MPFSWDGGMIKILPICVSLLLITACAGSSPTPASSPLPASSGSEPQRIGATEAQGAARVRDVVKAELAAVDAAIADLGKRLEVARDNAKADVKTQLTALQRREGDLDVQLRQTEALADAEADKARLEIHRAIMNLNMDVTQFAYRLSH
jgi:hypothetical protein